MKTRIVILVVYVDDSVITRSDKEGIRILINHLNSSFLTKDLGKVHCFLSIEVARSKEGISLSKRKYAVDILQRETIELILVLRVACIILGESFTCMLNTYGLTSNKILLLLN